MTFVSSEPPKRTLPPPFERPKIDISGATKREWQWVFPYELEENDIVPNYGQIKDRVTTWYGDSATLEQKISVKLVGAGKTETLDGTKKIWAFTRKPT